MVLICRFVEIEETKGSWTVKTLKQHRAVTDTKAVSENQVTKVTETNHLSSVFNLGGDGDTQQHATTHLKLRDNRQPRQSAQGVVVVIVD